MSGLPKINYIDLRIAPEHLPTIVAVLKKHSRYSDSEIIVGDDHVKAIGTYGYPCIEWHVRDVGPRVTHKTGHINYLKPVIEMAEELHKKLAETLEAERVRALAEIPAELIVNGHVFRVANRECKDAIASYLAVIDEAEIALTKMLPDNRWFASTNVSGDPMSGSAETQEGALFSLASRIDCEIESLISLRTAIAGSP